VDQALIAEEPLAIRVEGRPYSVVMRTPGDEKAHAAGFCLGEGLIDSPGDIAAIACCDTGDTNTVTVTLTPSRRARVAALLERRGFISQTSCGICGKALAEDLRQVIAPIDASVCLSPDQARQCLDALNGLQVLRRHTRATHAAALFSADSAVLAMAEDVGRHNALDKAIGKAFLEGCLPSVALVALSSRISFELVQRAARAAIPIIFSVSRPTALAVELAGRLNMTLACLAPDDGLFVYCGTQRLVRE
jgi:FdhD protein